MLPLLIVKCPETITPEHAEAVHEIVSVAFSEVFGKPNRDRRSNAPVVCASTAGLAGFWSLECNDPELDRALLVRVVERSRSAVASAVYEALSSKARGL